MKTFTLLAAVLALATGLACGSGGSLLAVGDEAPDVTLQRLDVGSSRVDLQACKLEYSIVSPK